MEKWRGLCKGVIDDEKRGEIERLCLGLEDLDDIIKLEDFMAGLTKNPIAKILPCLAVDITAALILNASRRVGRSKL